MRTFVPKRKSTMPARSPLPARPIRPKPRHSHQVGAILQLQQTVGNRAVQRQMPPEGAGQKPDSKAGDQAFWEWWRLVAGFEGWLKRNEERRLQARTLADTQTMRGQAQALARGRAVLQAAPDYDARAKSAAILDLSAVIGRNESQQAQGFANEDDERAMLVLKGQVLSEMGRVMNLGS